jgi:hypothetical protein
VNERHGVNLIFALYLLLAAGYSLLMPIWEAPDEPAHYHLAWHRETYGEDPSPEMNYEFHQPRGFYVIARGVIRALNTVDPEFTRFRRPEEFVFNIRKPERRFHWTDENYDFYWGVYVLRWVNILIGGLALWLNWKALRQIAPPSLAISALGLSGLIPQYLHIAGAVNNDMLGTLAGALLFYLVIRFLQQPTMVPGLPTIFLALLLPLLTKLTVLPVSAAVLLIIGGKWFSRSRQGRLLLLVAGFLVLAAGLLAFFFPEVIRSAADEIQWRLFSFRRNAFTTEYLKRISSQLLWTYWGKVGWLAVGLPFEVVLLLSGLGAVGMGIQGYRLIRQGATHPQRALWLAVGLIATFTMLAVFRNGLTTFAAQGRLLFPTSGALSLLMIAGWHDISSPRVQRYLPALILTLFVICNLYVWLTGVLPIYYQPFLD